VRVIAYSSGAWPCSIADYHNKLVREFDSSIQCESLTFPTDSVYRDQPLQLWQRRRHYAQLAATSRSYDVALIQFITHWNGLRDGEYALPVFANHLARPFALILHEWPPTPDSDVAPAGVKRVLTEAFAVAAKRWDRRGFSSDTWFREHFLRRAGHIFVHSEALRDQVLSAGIPASRVSFIVFPVLELPSGDTSVADTVAARFAGHRIIVIFGFPHPRKSLELAIQALPDLPRDVALLFVGGIDGTYRQQYVSSLIQLAGRLGVEERVEFVGEVAETALRAVFERAQFALAPFAYATGSASFAYLMAAGVPIVASDLPEHRMLHREGAGLSLFDRGNVAALVAAANGLLADADQRASLSLQSRAFVKRHSFASFANVVAARLRELAAVS